MNINVNNIIGSIESALKNADENSSKENSLPRQINPAYYNAKKPELNFRGKSILGRWYVDGQGAPFRKLSWLASLYMPYLNSEGNLLPRTIRHMPANNYVGMKPDEIELNRELGNMLRDISKDESIIPKYNGKYVPGTPILTNSREVVLMYFKPISIISNGVALPVPPLGPGSYICANKSGLLDKVLKAIQSENMLNNDGWINGVLSREGINTMSVLVNMDLSQTGKNYEATFSFKTCKGIELTQEDLDASKDLNNEYFSNIFDAERTQADINFLKEQIKIRREGALKDFEGVKQPEVNGIPAEEFKPVETPKAIDPDDDVPF